MSGLRPYRNRPSEGQLRAGMPRPYDVKETR